jgi:hypothetical protein
MKYITFENNDFDPNNFNKLIRDIKGITIELKDKGFRILHLNKKAILVLIIMILYKNSLNLGMSIFSISDVKDYIYTL